MVVYSNGGVMSYGSIEANNPYSSVNNGNRHGNDDGPQLSEPLNKPRDQVPQTEWHHFGWVRVLLVGAAALGVILLSTHKLIHESADVHYLYDYIIVGGGPSGLLAATKLARKVPTGRILILESGTATQSSVKTTLQNTASPVDWADQTLQLNKFDIPIMWSGVAREGPEHHWPNPLLLARALGGSGIVNAMIYVRALPEDFQRWNVTGWTWENILPHYKSLERYQVLETPSFYNNQSDIEDQDWRGTDGLIVTVPAGGSAVDAVAPLFVESLVNAGWPLSSRGFNSPNSSARVGGGYYDFNIRDGIRHSVVEALFGGWSAKDDPPVNLDIVTGATVKKVVFRGRTAVGVEYSIEGHANRALLRDHLGEVILACGAILTPQVLANSGISDGGSLVDLPGVGKNLQDHPVIGVAIELDSEIAGKASSMYNLAAEMESYFHAVSELKDMETKSNVTMDGIKDEDTKLGPLSTAGFSSGAFLTSPWATDGVPDIQLTVFPSVVEPHVKLSKANVQIELARANCMLATVALLEPEARYEVIPYQEDSRKPTTATDNDTVYLTRGKFHMPSVALPPGKYRYLTDVDAARMAWGIEEVRRIISHPPLSLHTGDEVYPGRHVVDDVLKRHIKAHHLTNSHWVGTAKMGTDELSVVDEELSVYGVQGLRIVDASIIPHIPNGNTHSTVCVIASHGVDLIFKKRQEKQQLKR